MKKALWLCALLASAVTLGGVVTRGRSGDDRASVEAPRVGYAPGPWWRADISDTLLMPAHVLVAHEGSEPVDGNLHVPGPLPRRPRSDALRLAQEIAVAARENPAEFDALARKHSDDLTTRARGGRLGPAFAPTLPPPFIDALGNLRPGEVSRVVETRLGYHVLKRLPPPPEKKISGSEIVIMYEGLKGPLRPDRERPTRSREEARELAERIQTAARANPGDFFTLVERHSDAASVVQQGDLGERSNHESWEGVILDVLSELEPGEVSDVIDDAQWGFRILLRTKRERPLLAHSIVLVGYTVEPLESWMDPSVTRTKSEALELAKGLIEQSRASTERFDALRHDYCDYAVCQIPPVAYRAGASAWPGLDAELQRVGVSEIVERPVWTPIGFLVARREAPERFPREKPNVVFELPEPPPPTLENVTSEEIAWYVRVFHGEASQIIGLSPEEQQKLGHVLETFATEFENVTPQERPRLVERLEKDLTEQLGEERYRELEEVHLRLTARARGELDRG